MNYKRIGRILICLVLVCALLVNISPLKARADVATGAIALGATLVNIPVSWFVAACAAVLGIGVATNDEVQWVISEVASSLGSAVYDGSVELLQTVNAAGQYTYYVACDLFDSVRSWFFDSGTIAPAVGFRTYLSAGQTYGNYTASDPTLVLKYCTLSEYNSTTYRYSLNEYAICLTPDYSYVFGTKAQSIITHNNTTYWYSSIGGGSGYIEKAKLEEFFSTTAWGYHLLTGAPTLAEVFGTYLTSELYVSDICTLASVPDYPIDGTSARAWAPEYANRGLYVVPGSGGNSSGGSDGKWFWPLFFGLSIGELFAMSQAEAWVSETPQEFDEYTKKEEYEVTPAPDFEGYPSIEISPITNPDVGSGGDSDTGTEGDTSELNWWERFTKWFSDLQVSINELPSKFSTWFSDLTTAIQELPTKFETWLTELVKFAQEFPHKLETWINELPSQFETWLADIKTFAKEFPGKLETWINELPSKIKESSQDIEEGITSIGEGIAGLATSIVSGLRTMLAELLNFLFVPEDGFMDAKVQSLSEEFAFVASIITTGEALTFGLSGVTTTPPIIYIDLGASTGSYNLGGKTVFMDLSWYAEYKPTVDILISAFLWICFIWRLILKLPGIINGMPGDFAMGAAHLFGLDNHLPSRNAAYEVQRAENRNYIKRGPPK